GLVLLALLGGGGGVTFGLLWHQADVARSEAVTARDGEAKAKREAEDAREKLAAVEYGRAIQLALQTWRNNNRAHAPALLHSTGDARRGWEWHYVHRLCNSQLVTLRGHTGHVHSVSFSPDGARLVTASGDQTAKVWDARTGTELLTLRGHTGAVYSASFSPDGTRLVTG